MRLWIALLLVIVFWGLNWFLPGLRTHLLFFPLWLGYALLVDEVVRRRTGTSWYTRNPRGFAGLFLVSMPLWWLFELLNLRLGNWEYDGGEYFSDFEYFLLASISFSTVVPAVFGTAELVRSFDWVDRLPRCCRFGQSSRAPLLLFVSGLTCLALMLAWPRYFYPLLWLTLFQIVEPLNVWLGHGSLLARTAAADWRLVVSLALGALICGVWWELWNYFSYPKWIYHVPYVDRPKLFEMPLAGYGGYLFFGPELYAMYEFVSGIAGKLARRPAGETVPR